MRLGLCCMFRQEPIKFVNTTATAVARLQRAEALAKLSRLCLSNAEALMAAVRFCAAQGIGCFRINSQILPVKTHPEVGYSIDDLPQAEVIVAAFQAAGSFAAEHDVRLVFHPDQYVVLNSPRSEVVQKSLDELEYHAEVAAWVGADVINIHAGGAYGDKAAALAAFQRNVDRLSDAARSRLTVENDDKVYTPADLLPLCRATGLPLVYDVHHHRCRGDILSVEKATAEACSTWNRQPVFHISSPLHGWKGPGPERHHDYIRPQDFPDCWRALDVTVEVEAKAKELAVARLQRALARNRSGTSAGRRPSPHAVRCGVIPRPASRDAFNQ